MHGLIKTRASIEQKGNLNGEGRQGHTHHVLLDYTLGLLLVSIVTCTRDAEPGFRQHAEKNDLRFAHARRIVQHMLYMRVKGHDVALLCCICQMSLKTMDYYWSSVMVHHEAEANVWSRATCQVRG